MPHKDATERQAYQRRYAAENREKKRDKTRQWRAEHPGRNAATCRNWQAANPEYVKKQKKAWVEANRQRHRESVRINSAVYRSRKRKQFVEKIEPLVVYAMHEGICGICQRPVAETDFHVDHVIPIARGGLHTYANVQPAHPYCNHSKGARLLAA